MYSSCCFFLNYRTFNGNSAEVYSGTQNCSIVRYTVTGTVRYSTGSQNLAKKNLLFNILLYFTVFRVSVNSELFNSTCNTISYCTVPYRSHSDKHTKKATVLNTSNIILTLVANSIIVQSYYKHIASSRI